MIAVALKGLAGRKLRATLTALAIVLGVAMVSGTYVVTDTIDRAFSEIFDESYAGTDVVVSGKGANISFQGVRSPTPPIAERLVERVREVPEVELAMGGIYDETATKIIGRDGKAINTQGAPSLGFGFDTSPTYARFNALTLESGRYPRSADEVVIDAATADRQGFEVGDRVKVASHEPVQEFTLTGIARFGDVDSLGTATFAVWDYETAQELLHRDGQVDEIAVAGKEGVTRAELIAAIEPVLPETAQVRSGLVEAQDDKNEISEFTRFIEYFLLAFAGIAVFVGAFVIFNTLSITVAQRTREFATLRTIGASRRQVLGSVILEALTIGTIASVIGLFAGLALANGLNALFRALNLDLPTTESVFATRTVVVSLVVGVVVALLAGLFPAIRATRVPPIAAVREGAALPRSRLAPLGPFVALALLALALGLLGYAMFEDDLATEPRLLLIAAGVLVLFTGVAMLSSRLVRPLAALVGWPARQIGGAAGRLARGNSVRNPGRTAATAAALMIGIALVTFVAVLANGMKASNRGAIEEQVIADYVVTSQDGFTPFVADAGEAVKSSAAAQLVTNVRSDLGKVAGAAGYVTGVEPGSIGEAYRFEWKEGSDDVVRGLGSDDAIVDADFAEEHGLAVGDRTTLLSSSNRKREIEVVAIYEPPPFYPILGSVSVSQATFDELYERPRNQFTFVNVPGDPDPEASMALEEAVADYPDAVVRSREQWIDKQDEDFNRFLIMLYVLLALSVIVSVFGMVNTLVLSVFERTRELGMLRAVGMTRRQVRRMVRHESVITALIGAALGLPLGIFLAALVTRALQEFEVRFEVPGGQLLFFAIVAAIVGVVAAILPARRAARLNVLEALQYE